MDRRWAALLVLAMACHRDDCGGDFYRTTLTAPVADTSGQLGTATIRVFEIPGAPSVFSLTGVFPNAGSGPLEGHVTSARLMRGSSELHRISVTPPTAGFLPAATDDLTPAEASALQSAAAADSVTFELATNLPGKDTLRVHLAVTELRRLMRSACDSP